MSRTLKAGVAEGRIGPRRFVLLLALCGPLWVCHCGSPSRGEKPETEGARTEAKAPGNHPKDGRWHPAPKDDATESGLPREAMERLQALPYLAGSQPVPARTGVTRLVRDRVAPGLNLYNSGHGPEALLADLDGRVRHRWSYPIDRIWPDAPKVHQSTYWRRVTWLPNGDVLAIFEGIGLIRLDWDSRLKWAFKDAVHHQAVVDWDGTVLTLTRKRHLVPRVNPDEPILEDYLTRLSSQGAPVEEFSLLEAFENSPHHHLLEGMKREGDLFHTNSIEVLDGRFADRAPWLKRGNLLLSMYFLDTICVVDPVRRTVVWALKGTGEPPFRGQHDPRILPSGRLLLFDNWGRGGKSKVIEFDPLTLDVAWNYPGDSESEFYTPTCGTSQRLENGNTLITESDRGRAFEVDSEGEIVWEFFNPHRAGPRGELIATLFEVRRVPEGFYSW